MVAKESAPERRLLQAAPSASSIIASLTMEELKAYCEVPDNIDLKLMDRADESTLDGEHNGVFFTPGASRSRATLPRASHSQAIFTFYPGAPGPCPPQCHPYFNRLLRIEPSVLARSLVGGVVYYLLFENRAGWPDVYVCFEPPTSGC